MDEEQYAEFQERARKRNLDLEDFLQAMREVKNTGNLMDLVNQIPGLSAAFGPDLELDPAEIKRSEAIIQSMTRQERRNPRLVNASRRLRIAIGSGHTVGDVHTLLKEFAQSNNRMR